MEDGSEMKDYLGVFASGNWKSGSNSLAVVGENHRFSENLGFFFEWDCPAR